MVLCHVNNAFHGLHLDVSFFGLVFSSCLLHNQNKVGVPFLEESRSESGDLEDLNEKCLKFILLIVINQLVSELKYVLGVRLVYLGVFRVEAHYLSEQGKNSLVCDFEIVSVEDSLVEL